MKKDINKIYLACDVAPEEIDANKKAIKRFLGQEPPIIRDGDTFTIRYNFEVLSASYLKRVLKKLKIIRNLKTMGAISDTKIIGETNVFLFGQIVSELESLRNEEK